jgi:hypothetical protein
MEQSNTTSASSGTSQAARGVMDRMRESATAQLSTQKTRATDGLGGVAKAVRQSAQPLRDNRQDMIADYVERAADQLEQFTTRLRDRDVSELMDDAQRFARRQPALFIGAAFAAGVIGARFLKSSSEGRRRSNAMQRYEPPASSGTAYGGATGYGSTPYGSTPGAAGSTGGF